MSAVLKFPDSGDEPKGIRYEWRLIGPDEAVELLGRNIGNRKLRKAWIEQLARDMREGRWQENGDTIRLDIDGNVLDGQHRLHAVITSERTIAMLVVSGLAPEVQDTIDIGAKRSAADALKFGGGAEYTVEIAAVARGLFNYKTSRRATNTEVLSIARVNHDALLEAVKVAKALRNAGMNGGTALFSIAWLELSQVDPDAARRFFVGFTEGAGLERGNPLLLLRKHFASPIFSASRDATTLRRHMAMIFRAWNAWRRNEDLTRYVPSADFPVPR